MQDFILEVSITVEEVSLEAGFIQWFKYLSIWED